MQNSYLGCIQNEYINKDTLLTQINQEKVWSDLLNFDVSVGRHFVNPWRSDNSPGCYLYESNGILRLCDFGSRDMFHTMDICSVIMYLHNISFAESLVYIKNNYLFANFSSNSYEQIKSTNSFEFFLQVIPRVSFDCPIWNKTDADLWSVIDVTRDDLYEEDIWPVHSFRMNSHKESHILKKYFAQAPSYVIFIDGKAKIRLYGNDNIRFISNFDASTLGGKSPIYNHKFLVVTKSLKDYFVFTKLGYQCRYIHNEGILLDSKLINFFNKFDEVLFFMDNDQTGIYNATRYAQLVKNGRTGYIPEVFALQGIKDPYEFCEKYSMDKFNELITHQNFKIITK